MSVKKEDISNREMTINEVIAPLEKLINLKIPALLIGPTGLGKSAVIKQIGKKYGRNIIDIRLSQIEYSDLRGIPFINDDKSSVNWSIPSFLPKDENDNSIIFLDEINCANSSVLFAAYQLVLDRKIGDYKLPKNVSIVAAGNKLEEVEDLTEIPVPLLNRFNHFKLKYDYNSWKDYAVKSNINKYITLYLDNNSGELYKRYNHDNAFATPRSWEKLSDILYSFEESDLKKNLDLIRILSGSCIGEILGNSFYTFLKEELNKKTLKFNLSEILTNEDYSIKENLDEEDLLYIENNIEAELYKNISGFNDIGSVVDDKEKLEISNRYYSYLDNVMYFIYKFGNSEFLISFISRFSKKYYKGKAALPVFTNLRFVKAGPIVKSSKFIEKFQKIQTSISS